MPRGKSNGVHAMTIVSNGSRLLSTSTNDIIASAIKSFVGTVPYAGPLFAEVVRLVIPQQRMDRIAAYARSLDARFSKSEQQVIRLA